MRKKRLIISSSIIIIMTALLTVSCGKISTITSKKGGNAGKKVTQADSQNDSDYLREGVILAPFMWENGGFSETTYYPSKILTQASEKTKNEYKVKSLIGDFDVAEGAVKWTSNVIIDSHPAKKGELKTDMIVLFTEKPADEGLKNARWHRGIVASTDDLYKNRVKIDYVWHLDKSDEADRQKNVPVENIRIIDKPRMKQAVHI